jgi:hypothetical protein
MLREFEISTARGVAVVPIGATGWTAKTLADRVISDPSPFAAKLDANVQQKLMAIAHHTDDLKSLIKPIIELVRKLQHKD